MTLIYGIGSGPGRTLAQAKAHRGGAEKSEDRTTARGHPTPASAEPAQAGGPAAKLWSRLRCFIFVVNASSLTKGNVVQYRFRPIRHRYLSGARLSGG